MVACVLLVATPEPGSSVAGEKTNQDEFYKAIGLGLLAPLFISIFISVSRFWTFNYGYKSEDFTIDTFMMMGILEIYFFFNY